MSTCEMSESSHSVQSKRPVSEHQLYDDVNKFSSDNNNDTKINGDAFLLSYGVAWMAYTYKTKLAWNETLFLHRRNVNAY